MYLSIASVMRRRDEFCENAPRRRACKKREENKKRKAFTRQQRGLWLRENFTFIRFEEVNKRSFPISWYDLSVGFMRAGFRTILWCNGKTSQPKLKQSDRHNILYCLQRRQSADVESFFYNCVVKERYCLGCTNRLYLTGTYDTSLLAMYFLEQHFFSRLQLFACNLIECMVVQCLFNWWKYSKCKNI